MHTLYIYIKYIYIKAQVWKHIQNAAHTGFLWGPGQKVSPLQTEVSIFITNSVVSFQLCICNLSNKFICDNSVSYSMQWQMLVKHSSSPGIVTCSPAVNATKTLDHSSLLSPVLFSVSPLCLSPSPSLPSLQEGLREHLLFCLPDKVPAL